MKLHWSFILAELVRATGKKVAPPSIDGDATPRHAWKMGYIAAMQDAVDALSAADKPSVAAE